MDASVVDIHARDGAQRSATDGYIARWTLRALVELGAWRKLARLNGGFSDELLWFVGLEGAAEQKLEPAALRRLLRERLTTLEATPLRRDGVLFDNVHLLGDALGLAPIERELLALAVAAQVWAPLRDALENLDARTLPEICLATARILASPPQQVSHALRSDQPLLSSGLVHLTTLEQERSVPFETLYRLPDVLLTPHADADSLIARFFRPPGPPSVTVADYPHLSREVGVVRRILAAAVRDRTVGVNVLLYGDPGTGKTELARALAAELGVPLFEVADEDADGDPLNGHGRVDAYRLCQQLVARRGSAIILFDEIEDVFSRDRTPSSGSPGKRKAWINRVLEQNPIPAFWITNAVDAVDPAYVRRFDFVLELRTPPRAVRAKMLARHLGAELPTAFVQRTSSDERLTPAHLARAARVADLAGAGSPVERAEIAGRYLEGALALAPGAARPASPPPALPYDLSLLNTDASLPTLISALARSPSVTACLYGPPGTGKTAFVAHLADALSRPLLVRRASDLLGPYIGETEANLARMFDDARREGAVLLLDEADSFLQDRAGAVRSWEVTQVNELLVQMEAFEGLFFCGTNAFDRLDPAALRRFAVKIRFDPPRPDQRWKLFLAALGALELPAPDDHSAPELRCAVDALAGLTPGDVHAVVRRAKLLGDVPSPRALLAALSEELSLKPEHRRAVVGFHAPHPTLNGPSPRVAVRAADER